MRSFLFIGRQKDDAEMESGIESDPDDETSIGSANGVTMTSYDDVRRLASHDDVFVNEARLDNCDDMTSTINEFIASVMVQPPPCDDADYADVDVIVKMAADANRSMTSDCDAAAAATMAAVRDYSEVVTDWTSTPVGDGRIRLSCPSDNGCTRRMCRPTTTDQDVTLPNDDELDEEYARLVIPPPPTSADVLPDLDEILSRLVAFDPFRTDNGLRLTSATSGAGPAMSRSSYYENEPGSVEDDLVPLIASPSSTLSSSSTLSYFGTRAMAPEIQILSASAAAAVLADKSRIVVAPESHPSPPPSSSSSSEMPISGKIPATSEVAAVSACRFQRPATFPPLSPPKRINSSSSSSTADSPEKRKLASLPKDVASTELQVATASRIPVDRSTSPVAATTAAVAFVPEFESGMNVARNHGSSLPQAASNCDDEFGMCFRRGIDISDERKISVAVAAASSGGKQPPPPVAAKTFAHSRVYNSIGTLPRSSKPLDRLAAAADVDAVVRSLPPIPPLRTNSVVGSPNPHRRPAFQRQVSADLSCISRTPTTADTVDGGDFPLRETSSPRRQTIQNVVDADNDVVEVVGEEEEVNAMATKTRRSTAQIRPSALRPMLSSFVAENFEDESTLGAATPTTTATTPSSMTTFEKSATLPPMLPMMMTTMTTKRSSFSGSTGSTTPLFDSIKSRLKSFWSPSTSRRNSMLNQRSSSVLNQRSSSVTAPAAGSFRHPTGGGGGGGCDDDSNLRLSFSVSRLRHRRTIR